MTTSACQPSTDCDAPVVHLIVPLCTMSGGLRLLLRGGLLPEGVSTVRFLCDVDKSLALRVRVIAFHQGSRVSVTEISPELRTALERCFVSFLRRLPLLQAGDTHIPIVWEWSAHGDALTCLPVPGTHNDRPDNR